LVDGIKRTRRRTVCERLQRVCTWLERLRDKKVESCALKRRAEGSSYVGTGSTDCRRANEDRRASRRNGPYVNRVDVRAHDRRGVEGPSADLKWGLDRCGRARHVNVNTNGSARGLLLRPRDPGGDDEKKKRQDDDG
jgi:hypothetical protein